MPIYEFFCGDCNALLNFFSARVDTSKKPDCPRCGRKRLERRPARFATLRPQSKDSLEDPLSDLDDPSLERLMAGMAGELETLGESDDPRQYARVLRSMGRSAGLEMGPRMEELLSRLEAGSDLDELESEMAGGGGGEGAGDEDDDFDEYFRLKKRLAALSDRTPRVDPELYFL